MQKKQVIIASILKPINDTRMYEKFGKSISKVNGFEINIVGFKGKIPREENMHFYPLYRFQRLNIVRRLLAPWQFYRLIRNLNPQVIIICTHELLWPVFIYSFFRKPRIIYDVRENYFLNIKTGSGFYSIFKPFISLYVRFKEWLVAKKIHHFTLAEKVYADQLGFVKDRWTYLPNAAAEFNENGFEREPYRLLFSGTIARETGVFEAVRLAEILYESDNRYSLKIIGYCPQAKVLRELENEVRSKDYITIEGGNELVDHREIVQSIFESGIGIISYHDLPQFRGKVPTKVFEYLKYGLTPLTIGNPAIGELIDHNGYYLHVVDKEDIKQLFEQEIIQTPFIEPLNWEFYEKSLVELLD